MGKELRTNHRILSLIIALVIGVSTILAGCGAGQTTPFIETPIPAAEQSPDLEGDVPSVTIDGIEVRDRDAVAFWGWTTVAEGRCMYTQLYQDQLLLEWWPVGKCYPITERDWRISFPLGEEGAPESLDNDAQFRLRVWWPGAPEVAVDEFDFDLASPPSP